uniref:Uncharacterized protein n=1 Tax=Picea sitchensis TaxID=3332 RepID=A9NM61_PICSI|nr:unknown [Picea sitchensis]
MKEKKYLNCKDNYKKWLLKLNNLSSSQEANIFLQERTVMLGRLIEELKKS